MLAEFADMALEAARDLHACALKAEDAEEKARLHLAAAAAARSGRQSMALEMRLARQVSAAAREDAEQGRREEERRVCAHRRRVEAAVSPLVWNEYDGDEADDLLGRIDDELDAAVLDEAFLLATVQDHIDRISRKLGLTAGEPAPPTPSWGGRIPSPVLEEVSPKVAEGAVGSPSQVPDHPFAPSG